jgi:hypothetical protein
MRKPKKKQNKTNTRGTKGMRVKTVVKGKRTAGTVHYCPKCAHEQAPMGEIDIFPSQGK